MHYANALAIFFCVRGMVRGFFLSLSGARGHHVHTRSQPQLEASDGLDTTLTDVSPIAPQLPG